ncbi:MAG: erythromycin biosynthesis sensory transduction protein eryC1 [Nitrospinae bacterium CG11_big_fil_rev_8_21_14_0_20_56_8]|nr:MAG: erythromycin biosynthesis sensory transduction protein eryC1 [Nitrospinae bacterium CG11_big_fil_rev_8_21_14_0_20_56_8]
MNLPPDKTVKPIIPFVDLKTQYQNLKEQVRLQVEAVFESTSFILGPQVTEFENHFATYCRAKYCIGVASGTDALHLALRALDIGEGDEVITAANTFIATALGISYTGATPVFVDADEKTFNLDLQKIEEKITPRTRAIIPVHLYGRAVDMDTLMKIAQDHNLKVVEDACQSHGANWNGKRTGTFGNLGCFSFYPGKNLGAYGDGGAVVTSEDSLYERLIRLRNYGSPKKYVHDILGFNSRLDTVQAAILNIKLPLLDGWNESRRKVAHSYNAHLHGVGDLILPQIPERENHVFHLYVVRTQQRDALLKHLNDEGIQSGIHYPHPIYAQGVYSHLKIPGTDNPFTDRSCKEILSLPMFPEMTGHQIDRVIQTIKHFFG